VAVLKPISRRELIRRLKAFGFEGHFQAESTSGCDAAVCA